LPVIVCFPQRSQLLDIISFLKAHLDIEYLTYIKNFKKCKPLKTITCKKNTPETHKNRRRNTPGMLGKYPGYSQNALDKYKS